jgi:hypothetical protein
MTDLSHLTCEQRRTWEALDKFAYAWQEGKSAAMRGHPAITCPYEIEAGSDNPRRRWAEAYELQANLDGRRRIKTKDLVWCRMQLGMPHTHTSAMIFRLFARAWRTMATARRDLRRNR